MIIDLARDFSPYPAGRFSTDGDFNGEIFREKILVPKLKETISRGAAEKLIIDIDGVRSFGSSFLEEAFGGLIRLKHFTKKEVLNRIEIRTKKTRFHFYKDLITDIIKHG
jgi:hypothetical protein